MGGGSGVAPAAAMDAEAVLVPGCADMLDMRNKLASWATTAWLEYVHVVSYLVGLGSAVPSDCPPALAVGDAAAPRIMTTWTRQAERQEKNFWTISRHMQEKSKIDNNSQTEQTENQTRANIIRPTSILQTHQTHPPTVQSNPTLSITHVEPSAIRTNQMPAGTLN